MKEDARTEYEWERKFMKLYLMRHGEAAYKENDVKQGLTRNGKLAIEQLAKKLTRNISDHPSDQKINIENVLHSEKARAQQTAEIMASILAPNVVPLCRKNLNPNDTPEDLLPYIETLTQETLITSHLPYIPSLLRLLTKDQQPVRFDPGTIVCLRKNDTNWHLEWVTRPD